MSVYTREEVAKHNKPEVLWIIIDNVVLDLTKFVQFHPGGATVLHDVAGQDATGMFRQSTSSRFSRLTLMQRNFTVFIDKKC